MRKSKFLKELSIRLSHIDPKERENILNYYDELIDDKIEESRKEEEAINELGSIDDIVARISGERAKENSSKRMRYDSDTIIEEPIKRKDKKSYGDIYYENRRTIFLVLLITFPLWIGFFIAGVSILFAMAIAFIAFAISGIAFIVSGIYSIIIALIYIGTNVNGMIFQIGWGLALVGIGCIITPLMFKASATFFNWFKSFTCSLFKPLSRGNSR